MAGSSWLSFHCSGTLESDFITIFYYHAALLVCGSLCPQIFLISTTSGMRTTHSVEFTPFLCHTSCVCSVFFIPPICRSGTRYFWFLGLQNSKFGGLFRLRNLCKGSGSSIDHERNVRILCLSPTYCLTNLVPFWVFFLVAGNSALITPHPSGSHGLQVLVQPFTFLFHGYIRSMRARASDTPHYHFFLSLFKGCWSFGVQF